MVISSGASATASHESKYGGNFYFNDLFIFSKGACLRGRSSQFFGRFLISMAGVIFDPAQPDQAK